MPDLSEYGDIVFATLDEFEARKIDGVLEDSRKTIASFYTEAFRKITLRLRIRKFVLKIGEPLRA